MGGSRRKYKRSKPKVRVGLPKKNPHIFKPAFNLPPKLKSLLDPLSQWDEKASVIENYKSFGVVSNPNFPVSARAHRTSSRVMLSRCLSPATTSSLSPSLLKAAGTSKKMSMFMDTKLNKMQHSVAALEKLCKRYHMHKDKNPLIVGS
ncbi:UNVERIFIED_CONTAM: hypothetical protein Sradi_1416200 [Sesamum radiatum]|uniref:Nucleolar protein 16 n=1 Tax=Sesamum radiatum TaxID=300843 RepID=A0AAW2USZ2_SESRA